MEYIFSVRLILVGRFILVRSIIVVLFIKMVIRIFVVILLVEIFGMKVRENKR